MKWRRGKSQFKKGSDWWKFSIWNRVMGSQPISIQLGKILREIVAEKCCRKILKEIVAGKSCGKFLWENLAGNSCGKKFAGNSCGKWKRGKSQFKKDSDWWKFSIWNRVMGSQAISIQLRKILQEYLAGNSCGKILREILAGNSCRKILPEIVVGKCCGKFLQENVAGNSCGKVLWENLAGTS